MQHENIQPWRWRYNSTFIVCYISFYRRDWFRLLSSSQHTFTHFVSSVFPLLLSPRSFITFFPLFSLCRIHLKQKIVTSLASEVCLDFVIITRVYWHSAPRTVWLAEIAFQTHSGDVCYVANACSICSISRKWEFIVLGARIRLL